MACTGESTDVREIDAVSAITRTALPQLSIGVGVKPIGVLFFRGRLRRRRRRRRVGGAGGGAVTEGCAPAGEAGPATLGDGSGGPGRTGDGVPGCVLAGDDGLGKTAGCAEADGLLPGTLSSFDGTAGTTGPGSCAGALVSAPAAIDPGEVASGKDGEGAETSAPLAPAGVREARTATTTPATATSPTALTRTRFQRVARGDEEADGSIVVALVMVPSEDVGIGNVAAESSGFGGGVGAAVFADAAVCEGGRLESRLEAAALLWTCPTSDTVASDGRTDGLAMRANASTISRAL
jgi:hypothetical protein